MDLSKIKGMIQTANEKKRQEQAAGLFGADYETIGGMNKDVIAERQKQLDQTSPEATRIKESANYQTRAAQATKAAQGGGNLSVGERAQIKRSAEADAAQSTYQSKQSAVDKYANTAASLASNTMGYEIGKEMAAKAGSNSRSSGTVICTELHRQGYLTDDIMIRDYNFGVKLREKDHYVYDGYMTFAPTVVKIMRKSKLFSRFISLFGIAWAKDMAYNNNVFGRAINNIGFPVCRIIGRISSSNYGENHHGF